MAQRNPMGVFHQYRAMTVHHRPLADVAHDDARYVSGALDQLTMPISARTTLLASNAGSTGVDLHRFGQIGQSSVQHGFEQGVLASEVGRDRGLVGGRGLASDPGSDWPKDLAARATAQRGSEVQPTHPEENRCRTSHWRPSN